MPDEFLNWKFSSYFMYLLFASSTNRRLYFFSVTWKLLKMESCDAFYAKSNQIFFLFFSFFPKTFPNEIRFTLTCGPTMNVYRYSIEFLFACAPGGKYSGAHEIYKSLVAKGFSLKNPIQKIEILFLQTFW